ncbi:MAG: tyrosine--tRNA ligase [Planctomycetota bacterium]|nr:MAG: tyrosine--tRNA ligase [Planctomycetota bacterium]
MSHPMSASFYDIMAQRGLIHQSTDEQMHERLQQPCTAYIGFDPTADSLHVGSLVPVMVLAWLQRCGHRPLALVGGATGMIGDPSGKTSVRTMLSAEEIAHNTQAIGAQIGRVVRFGDGPTDARLLNNADWLADRTWIDILRDYGPHFSVNRMLTMDSVKGRMEAGGITFLEFNYMVMQAADFVHLAQHYDCTLQMGGQDQWGNIVMGIELGRRMHGLSLAGLTMPLVTKADGSKFGKSEQGNIWLSAERTSVHDFFQFWRNVADADVSRFLAFFTFLPMRQINDLCAEEGQALNAAKETLAYEVTALIHGEEAAQRARDDARKAFTGGDVSGDSIPHSALTSQELASGIGLLLLMTRSGLTASNGEARRLVQGGGVRVNDVKITDPALQLDPSYVVEGRMVVRVGKKKIHRFDVVG